MANEYAVAAARLYADLLASFIAGETIQMKTTTGLEEVWEDVAVPGWNFYKNEYRVKPKEKPSIDWSVVADRYNFLAVDVNGEGWLFQDAPTRYTTHWGVAGDSRPSDASAFASFDQGDVHWTESLVYRNDPSNHHWNEE